MTSPPHAPDARVAALAQHAAALETRGAWTEAIGVWTSAVARDPSFLPAQLGLAQAQIRAGRPAEALPVLERVTARAPGVPGAWLALGVAQSMTGRHDAAIASAGRAVSIAPRMAVLHAGLGDVLRQAGQLGPAVAAYRQAAALAPDDPDTLNKLSVFERFLGKLDEAEALLRRALARAPGHPYVRVNLGTLALERRREAEGRAMLEAALATPGLPEDARQEAADALAMQDEHTVLAGPLAAALARNDPVPLEAALRALPPSTARDEALVTSFGELAARLAGAQPIDALFAPGRPASAVWPALEAHHNFHLDNADAALSRSVALVAGHEQPAGVRDVDVIRYARAVAERDRDCRPLADATAWNAWLRWRHAQIAGHRPELWPGQIKMINNLVGSAPQVRRTTPRLVAGTLAAIVDELAPRIPPGAWRAVFIYAALGEMHPFHDGNGRIVRFLLNRQLVEIGRFPHLRREGSDGELVAHLRETGDPAPLVDWLADGSRYAARLDAEWAARGSR